MNLRQIASIQAGHPFRGKIPEQAGSSVLAVQMRDISLTDGIQWASCIPTVIAGRREPDWLQQGDILVAARGSHNYAVSVDAHTLKKHIRAVSAPQFFIVRLNSHEILPDFITWLLNQTPSQRYFEQNCEGSHSKSIRRSVLENTPIAIPPRAKQQAIIGLARTMRQEQRVAEQLQRNNHRLMNSIANSLLTD